MGRELADFSGVFMVTPSVEDDELAGLQTNDIELERTSSLFNCKGESVKGVFYGLINCTTMSVDYWKSGVGSRKLRSERRHSFLRVSDRVRIDDREKIILGMILRLHNWSNRNNIKYRRSVNHPKTTESQHSLEYHLLIY